MGFCLLVYMGVAAVFDGDHSTLDQIDIHAPVADALNHIGYPWGPFSARWCLGGNHQCAPGHDARQIRILFAMARDGLLSPRLATIH